MRCLYTDRIIYKWYTYVWENFFLVFQSFNPSFKSFRSQLLSVWFLLKCWIFTGFTPSHCTSHVRLNLGGCCSEGLPCLRTALERPSGAYYTYCHDHLRRPWDGLGWAWFFSWQEGKQRLVKFDSSVSSAFLCPFAGFVVFEQRLLTISQSCSSRFTCIWHTELLRVCSSPAAFFWQSRKVTEHVGKYIRKGLPVQL